MQWLLGIVLYITNIVHNIINNRNLINSIAVALYIILIMNWYLKSLFFFSIVGRCMSNYSSLFPLPLPLSVSFFHLIVLVIQHHYHKCRHLLFYSVLFISLYSFKINDRMDSFIHFVTLKIENESKHSPLHIHVVIFPFTVGYCACRCRY